MNTKADEQLMGSLAAGDDSALGELMRRWQGRVWCFIDRMCWALHATDDIHQDVWTRVYLYRKRYKPTRGFRPYLFAVAINCCRTALRKGRRQPWAAYDADALAEQSVADDPPPVEAMVQAERAGQLRRAIADLPEAQKAVVLLYLLATSDYGEIASLLGLSVGTVRSHMHHALCRLRSVLTHLAAEAERQVDHDRNTNRQTR